MFRPKITSAAILLMFVLTSVWLLLVVVAPMLVPSNTLTDLSGRVGFHDNEALFSQLDPIPHAVYWIGDGECHQLADRSYFINGNQMPFCARDLGLFIGLAIGSGIVTFYRYKIHPILVLIGLVPLALDGGVQLLTDYESNNTLRMITGFIAGLVLALLLAHFMFALQEDPSHEESKPSQ
ncbi:MAG: DUF2085 domain-containing protein [Thermoplasmata archaeon]|nr:DUF2085 domain-containing protein [Thermoplasmata archaeon]MCJ7561990.1 DUF2085 domain-containing protein [Thermoplasmata archaeon]